MQNVSRQFRLVSPGYVVQDFQKRSNFGGDFDSEIDEGQAHVRLFVPNGCLGTKSSYDSSPYDKTTKCWNQWGGILLRPALMFDTNEREYPSVLDKSLARPGSASSQSENLLMFELSKRVTDKSSEMETIMTHDSHMDNLPHQKRRDRLVQWMSERGLSQSDIATRTKKSRSYVSLVLSAGKSFGERTARAFEKALYMPHLWLDGDTQPQEPPKHSSLGELLASTFDALEMDDETRRDAFVAASQLLITHSVQKKYRPSAAPVPSDVEAMPSDESPALTSKRKAPVPR